jgi:putative aldouronate transport system substrate-binding protein
VAVPTLQGSERIASWNYYSQYQIGNFVITSACKNPAVAAMWADTQLEMEAMLRQYIGAKDEAWEFAKEGDIGIGGQQAVYNYKVLWPPKPGEAWSQAGLSYRSSDYRLGERVDPKNVTFEKPLYEQTHRAYFPYRQPIEAQVPPLKLSNDQAGQIADLKVTIETYVTEALAKFVRGDMDPNDDGVWGKYLQTLDQMNLSTYLGVQQDALKAMKK